MRNPRRHAPPHLRASLPRASFPGPRPRRRRSLGRTPACPSGTLRVLAPPLCFSSGVGGGLRRASSGVSPASSRVSSRALTIGAARRISTASSPAGVVRVAAADALEADRFTQRQRRDVARARLEPRRATRRGRARRGRAPCRAPRAATRGARRPRGSAPPRPRRPTRTRARDDAGAGLFRRRGLRVGGVFGCSMFGFARYQHAASEDLLLDLGVGPVHAGVARGVEDGGEVARSGRANDPLGQPSAASSSPRAGGASDSGAADATTPGATRGEGGRARARVDGARDRARTPKTPRRDATPRGAKARAVPRDARRECQARNRGGPDRSCRRAKAGRRPPCAADERTDDSSRIVAERRSAPAPAPLLHAYSFARRGAHGRRFCRRPRWASSSSLADDGRHRRARARHERLQRRRVVGVRGALPLVASRVLRPRSRGSSRDAPDAARPGRRPRRPLRLLLADAPPSPFLPSLPPVPPPSPPDPQSSSAPSSAYDPGAHPHRPPPRRASRLERLERADVLYASDAPIGGRPEPVRRPAFALGAARGARVTSHAQVGEGFWLLRHVPVRRVRAQDAPVPPRGATRTRGAAPIGTRTSASSTAASCPAGPATRATRRTRASASPPSRGVRGASASRDTRSRWRRSRAPRCFRAAGARDARRDAPSARGRPNAVHIYAAVLRLPNVIRVVTPPFAGGRIR